MDAPFLSLDALARAADLRTSRTYSIAHFPPRRELTSPRLSYTAAPCRRVAAATKPSALRDRLGSSSWAARRLSSGLSNEQRTGESGDGDQVEPPSPGGDIGDAAAPAVLVFDPSAGKRVRTFWMNAVTAAAQGQCSANRSRRGGRRGLGARQRRNPQPEAFRFPAAGAAGEGEHVGAREAARRPGRRSRTRAGSGRSPSGQFRTPVSLAQRRQSSHRPSGGGAARGWEAGRAGRRS